MKMNSQYRSTTTVICLLLFIQCRCIRLDGVSHHAGVLAEETRGTHTSHDTNATSLQPGTSATKARRSAKEQEGASGMERAENSNREGNTNSEYTIAIDEEYLKASIRTMIEQHGKEWLSTSIRTAIVELREDEWLEKDICTRVDFLREAYKRKKGDSEDLEEKNSKDYASVETLKVQMNKLFNQFNRTDDRKAREAYASDHNDCEARVKQYERDMEQDTIQMEKLKESLPKLEVQISSLETLYEALKNSNTQLRTPTTSVEVSDESVLSEGTAKPYPYRQ